MIKILHTIQILLMAKSMRTCEGQQTRTQWLQRSVEESEVGLATPSGSQPAALPGRHKHEIHEGRERGEDLGTYGAETQRQKSLKVVTAGRIWKRQPRVGCAGRVLPTFYAPHWLVA